MRGEKAESCLKAERQENGHISRKAESTYQFFAGRGARRLTAAPRRDANSGNPLCCLSEDCSGPLRNPTRGLMLRSTQGGAPFSRGGGAAVSNKWRRSRSHSGASSPPQTPSTYLEWRKSQRKPQALQHVTRARQRLKERGPYFGRNTLNLQCDRRGL